MISANLSALISAANAIADDTRLRFGALTVHQLNWHPGADQWSVAECVEHLITTSNAYFPVFDKVLRGQKGSTFWGSVPWLPAFWGKLLMKAVDPNSRRKIRAPKVFRPSSTSSDRTVIRRFVDQQNQLIRYIKVSANLNIEKIIISSPVTDLVTYSLMDAYRIIITHQMRHLLQATRVLKRARVTWAGLNYDGLI